MESSVTRALTLARSAQAPGPDFPAGPASVPLPGEALPVPARLDRMLRLSLAGRRLRPVPSAGALHPVDTYLLVGAGCGLPPGVHVYDPARHRLHRCGPAPCPAPPGAVAVLGVTARRTVSHYGHRAWPLVLLDVGHAAAALALAGAHAVCLDADGGLLSGASGAPVALAAVRLTADAAPDGLVRWAARATGGRIPAPEGPEVLRTAVAVLAELAAAGGKSGTWRAATGPLLPDSVLLSRRSAPPGFHDLPPHEALARVLAAARAASPDGLGWTLAVSGPRPGLLTAPTPAPPAESTVPGSAAAPAHRTAPADGSLPPLRRLGSSPADPFGTAPAAGTVPPLRRLASGDVLPTLAHWAAGQGWIAGAGAVLLAHGCPSGATAAQVRHCHLAAGHGVAHAQAAATALGIHSRPVGSWQGADLGAALGGPAGRDWVVHGLALGRTTQGDEPS
ncbi:hypothetical protein [Streptomyces peucetius]|uniref:Nitroreductase n=1 Tax=Streptomyces peucetius TaxID=1950 RepID=A0ABY6IEE2_STRPE|nr:hypothetical protein [Streptomyces peucetius]UYQ65256.1 hypothetical protein OGH68_29855 [Streptomyces peucetius]